MISRILKQVELLTNMYLNISLQEKFKREFRILFRVCACRKSEMDTDHVNGEYSDDSRINNHNGSVVVLDCKTHHFIQNGKRQPVRGGYSASRSSNVTEQCIL